MTLRVPRITVQASYDSDGSLGEVNTLSLGYGLHQAWIYATLFGTASVFGVSVGAEGLSSSPVFAYSIVVYGICLLLFGLFDQRVLRYLVERRTAVGAAVLMCVGTLVMPLCDPATPFGAFLCAASGFATGLGSAALVLFWGVAFARTNNGTIVVNTAVGYLVAIVVYAVILHLVPVPFSGVLAAALPLAEVVLLWGQTPESYMKRHEVPIFDPLPVNRGRFVVLVGLPLLLFGLPLGFLRERSVAYMLPSFDLASQFPLLLAVLIATVVVIVLAALLVDDERPDSILRPLLPIIAVALFLVPLTESTDGLAVNVLVMVGYLCLEGMVWMLLCSLAQRYRISPVLVVGVGRGAAALGAFAILMAAPGIDAWFEGIGYGPGAMAVLLLVLLVLAFVLVPHEHDIRRAVTSGAGKQPEPRTITQMIDTAASDAADNGEAVKMAAAAEQEESPASSAQAPDAPPLGQEADEHGLAPAVVANEPRQAGSSTDAPAQTPSAAEPSGGAAAATDAQPDEPSSGGYFRKKCERIADRYLLSAREAEVLFFLAKGHNAAYLQERLFISEGTAKTHIRHIYGKTDVHNQQELMRLVADEWID